MKNLIVGVLGALLFTTAAEAGEWKLVGATDTFLSGIETTRIRDVRGKKVAWTIAAYREQESDGTVYRLSLKEFDCGGMSARTLSFTDYDISGSVTYTSNDPLESAPIAPETINEGLFDAACFGQYEVELSRETAQEFYAFSETFFSMD